MTTNVSIIIPLYNKEDVIWQTLNSVSLQSYKDWECIIVDDGSTDKSLEVVESFVARHPGNWRIIPQANQGQAVARNNGIANAIGNLLAFLDADDLWPSDKLSSQVAALEKNPSAVAVLSSYAIFGDSKKSLRVVQHSSSRDLMTRWLDMSGFGGGLESVGLVRRSAIEKIGLFDANFSTSSGLDFSLRLSGAGEILILKGVGLFYRLSPGQWHSNIPESMRNMAMICEKYSDIYRGDLSKSHSAYFFWALAQQKGRLFLVSEFLKSLFNLKNGRAHMLLRLVQRNLKSAALGRLKGRALRQVLTHLELENVD